MPPPAPLPRGERRNAANPPSFCYPIRNPQPARLGDSHAIHLAPSDDGRRRARAREARSSNVRISYELTVDDVIAANLLHFDHAPATAWMRTFVRGVGPGGALLVGLSSAYGHLN